MILQVSFQFFTEVQQKEWETSVISVCDIIHPEARFIQSDTKGDAIKEVQIMVAVLAARFGHVCHIRTLYKSENCNYDCYM